MMFAIVCDLPVPGGPWITSAGLVRARSTARTWQGSAVHTSRSPPPRRAADTTVSPAPGGVGCSTSTRVKLCTGPTSGTSPAAIASRSSSSAWCVSGNRPSTAAGTIAGVVASSVRGTAVHGRPGEKPSVGSSPSIAGRPNAPRIDSTSSPSSRHGAAPSSSENAIASFLPICWPIHASSASFGITRSIPSPTHARSIPGRRPLRTTRLTGTNAHGARMRLSIVRRSAVASRGGRFRIGRPICSAWAPVSCAYVRASSAMTESLRSVASRAWYSSSAALAAGVGSAVGLGGAPSSKSSDTLAASPSTPSRIAAGVVPQHAAIWARSSRCRLRWGRQLIAGPVARPAYSRWTMWSRKRIGPGA